MVHFLLLALSFSHFWHFFYWGHPWYAGAVWGNVFVVIIVVPLGWIWSKTKFWPLKPIRRGLDNLHARHDEHQERFDAIEQSLRHLHDKHDRLHEKFNDSG